MQDLEWYFFGGLDKKYGSSSSNRTNRATDRGYWKTTGKDRVIKNGEDAYVLCRVFQKSGTGPKNGEKYGAPFVEAEWVENVVEENGEEKYGAPFVEEAEWEENVVQGQILPLPPVNKEVLKQDLSASDINEWVDSLVAVDDDYLEMFDLDTSVTIGSVVEGWILPLPPDNNEVLKQDLSASDINEWVDSLVAVDDDYVEMLDIDKDSVTFESFVEGRVLPLPPARARDPDFDEWLTVDNEYLDTNGYNVEDSDFDVSAYLTDLGDIKNVDEVIDSSVDEY
ncbi:unnamed protein product [Trifolium pratense]|uniref:Uncharacterized protein n=1 Tax=Trifolium pratense TaxID=57577 RepID=A0ACB0IAD5_TRIPR|nr:unnamed protein product [Trifolium pratense]